MRLRLGQHGGLASDAIDIGEFIRFLITGGVATLGNMGTVWVTHHFASFKWSLAAGLLCGSAISFLMSKVFAFRSRTWNDAHGEAVRFALVYGGGVIIYWFVSTNIHPLLLVAHFPLQVADLGAVFCGGVVMALTSYFGHRFFTYRRSPRANIAS